MKRLRLRRQRATPPPARHPDPPGWSRICYNSAYPLQGWVEVESLPDQGQWDRVLLCHESGYRVSFSRYDDALLDPDLLHRVDQIRRINSELTGKLRASVRSGNLGTNPYLSPNGPETGYTR